MKYNNPIIRGFYPDPSICKANGMYYLVCSSFLYFPGVPLFESRDLINWTQIGCVLTRQSQLPLKGAGANGGIYAPTIRYFKGRFYIVTTNVSGAGNFYVWTDDIYGEWSEPIFVDQDGIDPSIYFEGNTCYFISNHVDEKGTLHIMQCELDIATGKKVSPSRSIWCGTGGKYLEAPHLYYIHGSYYLMAAEGGTEYGHMVVYAKGETPYGPFLTAPNTPVLTNRNKGNYQLQGAGHGDLVCDDNGTYWMVLLAFRQQDSFSRYHHLGRETCLMPVTFRKDGWMEAGVNGECLLEVSTERIPDTVTQQLPTRYTFVTTAIGREWVFIRNPVRTNYKWTSDGVTLKETDLTISEKTASPSFLGIRQKEFEGDISVEVTVPAGEGGLTLYMDETHHYDFGIEKEGKNWYLLLRRCVGDMEYIQNKSMLGTVLTPITLQLHTSASTYQFKAVTGETEISMGSALSRYLSSEVAGGFTGVMIGLYAVGEEPEVWCEFRQFIYQTN